MTQAVTFIPKQTPAPDLPPHKPFQMSLVTSPDQRRALFELRYRAYRNLMIPKPTELVGEYRDECDDLPTTLHFGAYDDGRLVGGMRLCVSRPEDDLTTLPCAAYYPALNPMKRDPSVVFMEVSRLSIEPGISNTSYRTTLYASLVRTSLMTAEAAGASVILVATRPEWVRFYKYMLGFDLIGEPAIYPPGDTRIALLGGSLMQARKRQRMQNAFFKISSDEISSMRRALVQLRVRVRAA